MIDFARLNWGSIINDGIKALWNPNEANLVRLIENCAVQLMAQLPKLPQEPQAEPLTQSFLDELKATTPIKDRIRFTSEGGFVVDDAI